MGGDYEITKIGLRERRYCWQLRVQGKNELSKSGIARETHSAAGTDGCGARTTCEHGGSRGDDYVNTLIDPSGTSGTCSLRAAITAAKP